MVFISALLNHLNAGISSSEPPSTAVMRAVLLKLGSFTGSDPTVAHGHHDKDHVLIRPEDHTHWIVFFIAFFVLIIFDNVVLNRGKEKISFGRACIYTLFFIACAGLFNIYIYFVRGPTDAFNWGTGYLLEWMLSVDNLFVFHRVFQLFKTPDDQKHKPLFFGIIGAIVFRMGFFCVEELLMHQFSWMHIVFGLFLIYTGVKAGMADDEDERPDESPVFIWITSKIPYVNQYTRDGSFFVKVPVDENRELANEAQIPRRREWKATKLMLVVIFWEITDLIVAVDSVAAIVAQIPDLFLAYTACVFAMLGLRATFFVIDELVKLFSLLGYGVALILIVLGVKLILRDYVHVPPSYFLAFLITTIAVSMIGSVIKETYWPSEEEDDDVDQEKENEKLYLYECASPVPQQKLIIS